MTEFHNDPRMTLSLPVPGAGSDYNRTLPDSRPVIASTVFHRHALPEKPRGQQIGHGSAGGEAFVICRSPLADQPCAWAWLSGKSLSLSVACPSDYAASIVIFTSSGSPSCFSAEFEMYAF